MKRFPFLDWMRGLAVVIMIQCHTFNSFARMDLREGGPYVLSQFVGGMAAPLFLFMAGMTLAFQMDSLERRELNPGRRWLISLRRAGYILGIAFAFRISNWVASLPHADLHEIAKVDILNCMGVGMAALSLAAVFDAKGRARFAVAAALGIAVAAPVVSALPWNGAPSLLREYLVPIAGRGHFAFFPCAAYIGFGLAAGTLVKRTGADRFERLMQWSVLIGFALVFTGQYFSNLPYSLYRQSSFWTDGPTLILIRAGISLLLMSGAYLWTEYCVGAGWSWMQCLGRNSLMVYWVHVMLVYGNTAKALKGWLSIPQTALATLGVIALMVALSAAWIWWKARKAERWKAATTVASGSPQALKAY
ncbi:MAG: acyltransferase [Acidobacteriia bacterium]|nr:acyltransferase [Terriglobia bacterium]